MASGAAGAERRDVVVVDDDDAVRLALCLSLKARGYTVRDFGSVTEFLDALEPATTGCLVLDVKMPDMDSIAVQAALAERSVDLPVIFVSGRRHLPDGLREATPTLAAVLEKPFAPSLLADTIAELFAAEP
ncbi:MAG: response regulator [Pseudomonadota bacterium]